MRKIVGFILYSFFSGGTVFWLLIVGLIFGCTSLLGQCDSSESKPKYTEHEYELLSELYYKVYEEAEESYWKLANMYDDLYTAYRDDPGRTGSLDGFIEYDNLEGALPDDVVYFLDD
jgi:hypothetical protein